MIILILYPGTKHEIETVSSPATKYETEMILPHKQDWNDFILL